ncbi:MAG: hypothetical protein ABJF11_19200 [Reichenbachiella sp.]|uniref:TPM domain-containing protein n=1 Tax=Reichenbachiella sp. TaxID=2184521 RepID=UPI00326382C3
MRNKIQFSDADKQTVKEAVQHLEQKTSGELVVYFARDSDGYFQACWKMASLFVAIFLGVIASLSYLWLLPESISILTICLLGIATLIVGFAIPYFITSLRVSFTPDETVFQRVLTKARDIFLQEQVFDTNDRIGILIYISELEHQVQILGDSGINAKIQQEDWDEVLGLVIQGLKNNTPAKGIADAIQRCEELLLSNGFNNIIKPDNELSDEMRIEE